MSFSVFILLVLLTVTDSYPQKKGGIGSVTGRIVDNQTEEPLFGVTVIHRGSGSYTVTAGDGKYTLSRVPVGSQEIEFQLSSYGVHKRIATISKGKATLLNVNLSPPTQAEVVVRSKSATNTDRSLLSKRKKAVTQQDAISAEQISRSTDNSASSAAQRITGINIVGGKFIFVRGLGERYSLVLFNNSYLPSPEPDKRVVPLNIFPTALLDSLVISKTYSSEMPGSFAGGVVNINSQSYPSKQQVRVQIGTGFNTLTTLRDFTSYRGSRLDIIGLGAQDSTRKLPSSISNERIHSLNNAQDKTLTSNFANVWNIAQERGKLPLNINFSYGNTFQLSAVSKLGFLFAVIFRENSQNIKLLHRHYSVDGAINESIDIASSTYQTNKGVLTSLNYSVNGFHDVGYSVLYSHSSEDTTRQGFRQSAVDNDIRLNLLNYVETSLLFNQIHGNHLFQDTFGTKLHWDVSYSRATRNQPDAREATYFKQDGVANTLYEANNFLRRYNNHADHLIDVKPYVEFNFRQWSGLRSAIKGGASYSFRFRDANNRQFAWQVSDESLFPDGLKFANPEEFFRDVIEKNLFNAINFREDTGISDSYEGNNYIISGYIENELPLSRSVRLVTGIRVEYSDLGVTSLNPFSAGQKVTASIKKTDPIPSLNLVYNITKNIIARTSYSYTVNRPDFKDISLFASVNIADGESFVGNPQLEQTNIHNTDLRLEWYTNALDLLSLSFFHKHLEKPAEVIILAGASERLTLVNVDSALNLGIEFEIKQSLDHFVPKTWGRFLLNANVSWLYSKIFLPDKVRYYEIGNSNPEIEVPGSSLNGNRPLQGQAPYIVNLIFTYEYKKFGTAISSLFNISGRYITRVGFQGFSNETYQESIPSLGLAINQIIYKDLTLKLIATNLLDPILREVTEIVNTKEREDVRSYRLGRNFGLSLKYVF